MEDPDVTLAILSGGRATRMGGFPKGLLVVEGQTIIERLLSFAPRFKDALIVANDAAPYLRFGARIVADIVPDRGAPGGLHAALAHSQTDWVLLVACDLPFVSRPVLDVLLAARSEGVDWVMFEREGRAEPLLALYRTSLAEEVRGRLAQEPSVRQAVSGRPGRVIPHAELRRADPADLALQNVNTPADAQRVGVFAP